MGEARSVGVVAERQHVGIVVPAYHRRKLEEIADQHDLHAAERRRGSSDMAADLVDQREAARRQHRDLVDD